MRSTLPGRAWRSATVDARKPERARGLGVEHDLPAVRRQPLDQTARHVARPPPGPAARRYRCAACAPSRSPRRPERSRRAVLGLDRRGEGVLQGRALEGEAQAEGAGEMEEDLAVPLRPVEHRRGHAAHRGGRCRPRRARRPRTASRRAAHARTTPPLPTWARPTSNCGFTRATISAGSARHRTTAGRILSSEMKDTSTVARVGRSGNRPGSRWRAFTPSHTTTRGILAETRVELPVADVDRVDAERAPAEQAVGEPARGRADVEADTALDAHAEGSSAARQLLSPAPDEGRRGRPARPGRRGRPADPPSPAPRRATAPAREDQPRGLGPARRETPRHEELVEAKPSGASGPRRAHEKKCRSAASRRDSSVPASGAST